MSDSSDEDTTGGFAALGLDERILATLGELGYEEPTAIQREAIPPLLEGRDLMGQAATGTGKTAAFALPLVERLVAQRELGAQPSAAILVPTRELAMQVAEAVHRYGRALDVSVLAIYGGQPYWQQFRALQRGVDVIVATPGRARDHVGRGSLDLRGIRMVVLDEADEMLDMGFAEDLESLLDEMPPERQTVLFSATMPPRIATLARRHLRHPVDIRIAREQEVLGVTPRVRQTAYVVARAHKIAVLGRLLDIESPSAAIVFCRTRNEVDELTEKLSAHGQRCEALHGGMSQEQRSRVMKKLRDRAAELVVATDVAARGLDIPHLTHVINFDVPSAPEAYVHRIGRVGRAGREGVAITLVEPRERRLLRNIEELTRRSIDLARVPTLADLHTYRIEVTRAAIRAALLEGGLDPFRAVVDSLAEEFDVRDVAMAATKLAHGSMVPDGIREQDLPEIAAPSAPSPTRPRGSTYYADRRGPGDATALGRRPARPVRRR